MKRTIAIITLIGLPALLIALAGVRLVMYDRSGICSAVANQPECTCGCREKHGRANAEVSARAERMATEAGAAILLLLIIILLLFHALRTRIRTQKVTQQLQEARDSFFTNITHEFRTPLTVILGLGQQMEQAKGDQIQEVRSAAKMIVRQGNSLLGLINKMLEKT